MPPYNVPPNSGMPAGLHPQDYQEHLPQASADRQTHGFSAMEQIKNQFRQLGYAFKTPQQDPLDTLAHIMNQPLGNERLGAERSAEVEQSNNYIFDFVQRGMQQFGHEVRGDLQHLNQRMQSPDNGRPPAMPPRQTSPRPESLHERGSYLSPRPSSREPYVQARSMPMPEGFDFNALSHEQQLEVMAQDGAIMKRTADNAKKSTQYKNSIHPWKREHHVTGADDHLDAESVIDEAHPYQDSDAQSMDTVPLHSPYRPDEEEIDPFDETAARGDSRQEESRDAGKGPALPPRRPAAAPHDDVSAALENRSPLSRRSTTDTAMPMKVAMQPTASLSSFPPPPSRTRPRETTQPGTGAKPALPPRNLPASVSENAPPPLQLQKQSPPLAQGPIRKALIRKPLADTSRSTTASTSAQGAQQEFSARLGGLMDGATPEQLRMMIDMAQARLASPD